MSSADKGRASGRTSSPERIRDQRKTSDANGREALAFMTCWSSGSRLLAATLSAHDLAGFGVHGSASAGEHGRTASGVLRAASLAAGGPGGMTGWRAWSAVGAGDGGGD
jgi:hypothetical protein